MIIKGLISLLDLKCDFLSGFAFKSNDYQDHGIPLIKIGNMHNRIVEIDENGNFVGKKLINEKTEKFLLSNDDILIAMTGQGSVGRIGKLKLNNGQNAFLNQRVGKFLCDEIHLNKEFLYYILTTERYQDYLFNTGAGSGQPNLSPELILQTEIPICDYNTQKAIASVLSSLDDKIDLLHRQNKTLEQMAETLFRQWFVEEAQEDWEEGVLSDLGVIITGKTPSKNNPNYWGDEFSFITPTDFKSFGMFSNSPDRKLSKLGWNKMKTLQLPKNSILVTCIGSDMGKVVISSQPCITNQQLNSIVINNQKYLGFVFQYLKSQYLLLRNMAFGGTTMPIINKYDFSNIKIPIPPENIIEEFQSLWVSFSKKVLKNQTQICTLEKMRDTLLPKLMSGEVRVDYREEE